MKITFENVKLSCEKGVALTNLRCIMTIWKFLFFVY